MCSQADASVCLYQAEQYRAQTVTHQRLIIGGSAQRQKRKKYSEYSWTLWSHQMKYSTGREHSECLRMKGTCGHFANQVQEEHSFDEIIQNSRGDKLTHTHNTPTHSVTSSPSLLSGFYQNQKNTIVFFSFRHLDLHLPAGAMLTDPEMQKVAFFVRSDLSPADVLFRVRGQFVHLDDERLWRRAKQDGRRKYVASEKKPNNRLFLSTDSQIVFFTFVCVCLFGTRCVPSHFTAVNLSALIYQTNVRRNSEHLPIYTRIHRVFIDLDMSVG